MSERLKFGVPRKNNGDLTLDRASALNVMRTEVQIRPHDGFKPEAVMVNYLVRLESDAERMLQLAKPPAWTETPGLPCIPTTTGYDLTRKFMDRWDTNSEAEAQALCAGCPVRPECLAAAIEEEHGLTAPNRYLVRGGLTPAGRVQLERQEAS